MDPYSIFTETSRPLAFAFNWYRMSIKTLVKRDTAVAFWTAQEHASTVDNPGISIHYKMQMTEL